VGIIAERPRVQLDSNIVSGLALDDVARDCVREYRRNGAIVLLSPAVVRELCLAGPRRREKLVAAAIEYCDGFTNLPVADLLALELQCITEARRVPPVPIVPIGELRRILREPFAVRHGGGVNTKSRRAGHVKMLEDMRREMRGDEVEPTFEKFLKSWSAPIFKSLVDSGVAAGRIPRPKLRADGVTSHSDKHGLVACIGIFAANMYRKLTGTMLKGEGCFSDLNNLIEIAHSDVLLTRDKELFECSELLRTVIRDARPEIRLVPQP
jgi:hypothetical protein